MRYLKAYENYSESDISSEIKDIFFSMIHDDNVEVSVKFKKNGFFVKNKDIIEINFVTVPGRGKSIDPLIHIESFDHLNSFLESEGYVYFSDGSCYNTYQERRKSFGHKLSLLSINYIKMESNESTKFISESPMRSDINDILLELKEEGNFETLVSIREEDTTSYSPAKARPGMEYGSIKNQFCKIEIANEDKFEYSDISEYVERLKDYMAMNNFYCYDFSSYFGPGGEKQPKIQMDLRRQYNRFGNERWTEKAWLFEISFKSLDPKDLTNEELKSDVYKSAADKLKKLGHIKRPEELMKWHDIIKKREEDTLKSQVLNDCKQLGVYQLSLGYRTGGQTHTYVGDFYINIYFDPWNIDESYEDWKQDGGSIWMCFSFGVIPVNEDGVKFCEEVVKNIIGLGGDKVTYWLGAFWLNMSESNQPGDLKFKPAGKGYFEEYEGSWHLSNRSSAMKLKDALYKIFNGDIIIRENPSNPGGEKEKIIDYLCNDRNHDIEEFVDIMDSIKKINLNKLYKD